MSINALSDAKTDRMLIERFAARVPGFNLRPFGLIDLYEICAQSTLILRRLPMDYLHGCAFVQEAEVFIYVNSVLPGPEQVIAGFHEYCHVTDHALDVEVFVSTGSHWNNDKRERQAQIVGVVALMPITLIRGLSADELMREFGVRRAVAEFRLSLGF